MGFAEALSDDGSLTGRGHPWMRGLVCGLMTALGGIGHTLPFLISDFRVAMTAAIAVVLVELAVITWIRQRYMDTPIWSAALQVGFGGALVFATGILIGAVRNLFRRGSILCMGNFVQDLRYAFRTLRKAPLFTSVAVLSLALGIGANTAIFTLVNQLILQLLPVRDPEQLVLLTARGSHYGSNTGANAISYPMYQDFRDKNQVFQGMFCRFGSGFSLTYEGRTELISGELVSGNYFPVLGVGAALGRVFTAQDDLIQGGHPIAVLSYGYWKTRFAADPNA